MKKEGERERKGRLSQYLLLLHIEFRLSGASFQSINVFNFSSFL